MSIYDCNFALCESITLVDDIICECNIVIMVMVSFLYFLIIGT